MHRLQLINWTARSVNLHRFCCHIRDGGLRILPQSTQESSSWCEAACPLLLFPAEPMTVPFTSLRDLPCAKIYTPPMRWAHIWSCTHAPACRWRLLANPGVLLDILPGGEDDYLRHDRAGKFSLSMSAFLLHAQRYTCYLMDRPAVWTCTRST